MVLIHAMDGCSSFHVRSLLIAVSQLTMPFTDTLPIISANPFDSYADWIDTMDFGVVLASSVNYLCIRYMFSTNVIVVWVVEVASKILYCGV